MPVIAAQVLDIKDAPEKVMVRLLAPLHIEREDSWICRFEVEGGIEAGLNVTGETALQALALAMKGLASVLYSSDLYRSGRLGFPGDFGGHLGLPAPQGQTRARARSVLTSGSGRLSFNRGCGQISSSLPRDRAERPLAMGLGRPFRVQRTQRVRTPVQPCRTGDRHELA